MSEQEAPVQVTERVRSDQLSSLEAALRGNPEGLLAYFARTATTADVRKVAGGSWREAGEATLAELRAMLQRQMDESTLERRER